MPEIDTAHEAVPASEQAEKRTEEPHRFMRSVRRATVRQSVGERLQQELQREVKG